MPKVSLELKLNLENITNLIPDGEDFRWYVKLKCSNCGEQPDHWHYVTLEENCGVKGSRGSANFVEKCKLCGRQNHFESKYLKSSRQFLDIVKDSLRPYRAEGNGKWQRIVTFECRGMEPTDFDPRIGWKAEGTETCTPFVAIDLSEKEWCDYDEKASASVGIYEWEHRFVKGESKSVTFTPLTD